MGHQSFIYGHVHDVEINVLSANFKSIMDCAIISKKEQAGSEIVADPYSDDKSISGKETSFALVLSPQLSPIYSCGNTNEIRTL